MREIKFRAWDKYAKEIVSVKTLDFGRKGVECAVDFSDIHGEVESEWDLEQFTGLRDKNGKEIYEADIVKVSGWWGFEFIGKVIYDRFGFNLDEFWCSRIARSGLAFSEELEWEVVGNIHENKELLYE